MNLIRPQATAKKKDICKIFFKSNALMIRTIAIYLSSQVIWKFFNNYYTNFIYERTSSITAVTNEIPYMFYTGITAAVMYWVIHSYSKQNHLTDEHLNHYDEIARNNLEDIEVGNATPKLLKDLLEKDRLKTEFFINISRELKTPLNIILGVIQLVTSEHNHNDIDSFNRYVGMMRQNCYRLLRLIDNLIDITRLEAGFLRMDFKHYNLVSVVEDITLSVAEYVKSKNVSIIFDTDIEEKIITCDVDKIERVMLNLLSNALKFTEPSGTIVVELLDGYEYINICVKDTGIGIPNDMLDEQELISPMTNNTSSAFLHHNMQGRIRFCILLPEY
ncbi:sensor histidine kinase [Anaerosolibacter sp.]|uniref:sensor histidine kinase n=1 Tax=Anaerosolibacter sp. TaxID=1872527 RepID=UPI0039EE05A1